MDQIHHKYVDIRGLKLHIAEIGTGRTPTLAFLPIIPINFIESIHHKYVDIRGLKLHIAEIGTGPSVVVFLHGFPEIWYSWRHQMIAIANIGFRAIAPDLRGYGLSEQPTVLENASFYDFVQDLLAILDFFGIPKAFLVGKDFGAWPVYLFALLHPARVSGIVSLGVPFFLPRPHRFDGLPEGFYITRWRELGRAEADFVRFDVKTVLRNIYILFSRSEIPIAERDQEIMDLVDPSTPLPAWFTEEDLQAYATLYDKSKFVVPLQVPYRSRHKGSPTLTNTKVEVAVLLIMGGKDYFLKFPGINDYISSGKVKEYVCDLEITFLPEGTHFVQEQFPEQVNQLITTFLISRTVHRISQ